MARLSDGENSAGCLILRLLAPSVPSPLSPNKSWTIFTQRVVFLKQRRVPFRLEPLSLSPSSLLPLPSLTHSLTPDAPTSPKHPIRSHLYCAPNICSLQLLTFISSLQAQGHFGFVFLSCCDLSVLLFLPLLTWCCRFFEGGARAWVR